jgi:hypothetical protein
MNKRARNALMFVVLLTSSVLVSPFVDAAWIAWVGVNRTYSSSYVWWSQAHLVSATDEFLLLLVIGAMLPVVLNVQRPILWAVALGATFGLVQWGASSNWVNPEAGVIDYFWAYSPYFAPVIGAVAGASAILLFRQIVARNVA